MSLRLHGRDVVGARAAEFRGHGSALASTREIVVSPGSRRAGTVYQSDSQRMRGGARRQGRGNNVMETRDMEAPRELGSAHHHATSSKESS